MAMVATTRTGTAGGDIGGLVMAGLIMAERAIAGRNMAIGTTQQRRRTSMARELRWRSIRSRAARTFARA